MKKLTSTSLLTVLRNSVMYLILVALMIFFAVQNDVFLTLNNLRNIINQASYQIIVGVGIGLVMLSGGMDLSVGYQMSLIGVCMGWLMSFTSIPWPVVFLIGILLGVVLSLFNGILTVKLQVFPFILTLATSYIYQGISYTITQTQTYRNFPDMFKWFGQGKIGPIPVAIIIMVVCVVIGSLILNKTYFGRYIYGIGSNEKAVELAGVNVNRMKLVIYALAGVFVALGTIVLISRSGSSASSMGPGTEFTIIAGGILGGIKMGGGGGKMSSIVIGVLILTVLSNGMQLMQLNIYPQYIVRGFVLIFAIGFDTYQSMQVIKKAKQIKD